MASQWYYRSQSAEIGPISSAELRELVTKGKVDRETKVPRAPTVDGWPLSWFKVFSLSLRNGFQRLTVKRSLSRRSSQPQ